MKTPLYILLIILSFFCQKAFAQGGTWVWMKGSSKSNDKGNYGNIGVANKNNCPPSRYEPAYWSDKDGNFWLFGGTGNVGTLSDLWKFDNVLKQWVWINGPKLSTGAPGNYGSKGVPSTLNYPPARGWGANCWTDNSDDLWLYGGMDAGSGIYSDLWRYHIATNEWTWMSGVKGSFFGKQIIGLYRILADSNQPGKKYECKSGWVDSLNRLWMYGGWAYAKGTDMWMYDISSNQWAWMKGSPTSGTGKYGALGVEDSTNSPASTIAYTRWKDNKGSFYLFSKTVLSKSMATSKCTNEIWRYNPATNKWTWLAGDTTLNDTGHYIQKCVVGAGNYPRGRLENTTAQTVGCAESFWSFGGMLGSGDSSLNDLWLYNSISNEWTWVSGSNNIGDTGYYGQQGVSSAANDIPSRGGGALWTDNKNNLWVFGGYSHSGFKNDLWEFIPDPDCIPLSNFSPTHSSHLPSDTIHCPWQATHINIKGLKNIQVISGDSSFARSVSGDTLLFKPQTTTTYTITYGQNGECANSGFIRFAVHILSTNCNFFFSDSVVSILSPTVKLINDSKNASDTKYQWFYNGSVYSYNIDTQALFTTPGIYCFTLVALDTSYSHCSDTSTHCLRVKDTAAIFVPSAFSPNGDGVNDYFKLIYSDKIQLKTCHVFNRWGQLVFSSITQPWDGTYNGLPEEVGTYVYLIEAINTTNNKQIFKKGNVLLLR